MGFFDHLNRKGVSVIKPQGAQIRTVEKKNTATKDTGNGVKTPSRRTASTTDYASSSKSTNVRRVASDGARLSNGTASSRSRYEPSEPLSPRISELRRRSAAGRRTQSATANGNGSGRHSLSRASSASSVRSRKRPTAAAAYEQPLSSDSSDDDLSDFDLEMRKRVKMSVSVEPDFERRIKYGAAFADEEDGTGVANGSANGHVGGDREELKFVHAADITPKNEFDAAFRVSKTGEVSNDSWTTVDLQYPSKGPKERFTLVVPHDSDGFKPIDDIVRTIEAVADNYIPAEHLAVFDDPTNGIKRRLRRALAHSSKTEFCEALFDYNKIITKLRKSGVISHHLDSIHSLPLSLIERILTQIYARTVSPRVETLRRYENGSDNVYGELLPRFITDIFKQTKLKSGQVFVDLGSGVGNVVLQAALEIGCESWGCEMMSNACDLAELQQREFEARCSGLWGLSPGDVHLVRGDFLKEDAIINVLRRADVVLINNQAFTPQLNDKITNLFLDLKEGAQIVSLKSFVPAGHKISARNLNSPINLLRVKKFEYWSEYVSWTDAGGDYYVATKDSEQLRRFASRM